jgi:hypothetical protein
MNVGMELSISYSLHKEEEEEEQGDLALGDPARREPLDENSSSSALWWLPPTILISPTRSMRLCCSGREPQQLVYCRSWLLLIYKSLQVKGTILGTHFTRR